MSEPTPIENLTPALEDYLETMWEILQVKKVAQVTEIAERRGVNVASVTPAMRRLMKMGLVDYTARAYVDLTPKGMDIARRVKTRHNIIKRFLSEILGVSESNAAQDACAAEHMFSDETIDRVVRFFEYVERCDDDGKAFLTRFLSCSVVHPDQPQRCNCSKTEKQKKRKHMPVSIALADVQPGKTVGILQVVADASIRQALIDRGMISGETLLMLRVEPDGESIWVRLGADEIQLSMTEAKGILVVEAAK